jgi:hypothetical protein
MRQSVFLPKPARWFIALGLAALLLGPGMAWSETLKVSQPNQQLYPQPDFASTPIAPVPVGAEVNVVQQSGDWYKVDYQGQSGWLNRQAFPQAQAPSKFGGLPSLLLGGPVKETKSDEVALAGKGFTPEVESAYKQKHPEMKFAQVDQVEALRVDGAKLQTFIREGGLNP